ncbi:MAG: hypothetical protein HY260_02195 [Chloroflexi bacterium]|nr:hypothetical protein [Chloroflexota bacterium]
MVTMLPDPDYRLFDLSGNPYTIGFHLGAATAQFTVPARWPPPPDLDFALACEKIVADLCPSILGELRGYADGQGIPYHDLLRGVCRRTMRLRRQMPVYPEGGCSSFAVVGPGGHSLVGRNYDFHPVQRIRQRIRLSPDEGLPSVGARGSVPGGRYDGVNAKGLFICLHVVLSDSPDDPRPGVPFHLIPRIALETCATVREAVDLLLHLPHLNSFNYLLADSSGAVAVVEAHPLCVRSLDPGLTSDRRPFAAAANHFRHPDMLAFQRNRKLDHSTRRCNSLSSSVSLASLSSLCDIPPLLADHSASVCGHRGGHTTLWSLAADLTAREIEYAPGPPCVTSFERARWPGA